MFKKLVIASAILAATSTVALANYSAPYVGVSTGLVNNTTQSGGVFRGMPATVFGGYGTTVNQNIYLAGEIFGTLGTLSLTNAPTTSYSLRSTTSYGLSFIPGLMLADHTMAFARLGLARTNFSNIGSTATGYQAGLGMQTGITQCWDLRGEYDFTSYNSVGHASPMSDLFSIGLVYKFE